MTRDFSSSEIDRLRALRSRFLGFEDGTTRSRVSYWNDDLDLELYDATFAERIGWKWDAVLAELASRSALPRPRTILDWGTGTGVASRRVVGALGVAGIERVFLWDQDLKASTFAARRLRTAFPGVQAETVLPSSPPDLIVVSHVLDELDTGAFENLLRLLRTARCVLWVEPGSRATSRRLAEGREALRGDFAIVAPCPHQGACGALAQGRDQDWCHFFAAPPPAAFTDSRWAAISRELGIDLRSLAYSFLALGPRSNPAGSSETGLELHRLLGRPSVTRGRIDLTSCAPSGLHDLNLLQRTDRPLFKSLSHSHVPPFFFTPTLAGQRITSIELRSPRAE